MKNEKFISAYIDFIANSLKMNEHLFIIIREYTLAQYAIPYYSNIIVLDASYTKRYNLLKLSGKLNPYFSDAKKIIIHGLFGGNVIDYLFLNQNFLHKCNWMVWGADLYDYQNTQKTLIKKALKKLRIYRKSIIIKKFGGIITYLRGDYELAQKWSGAQGKYYECFMYPSNLYKEYELETKDQQTINIQIGNSADTINNHLDILKKLEQYKDDDIMIIAPLSYGDQVYAKKVIEQGQKVFGDKFVPLTDFLAIDQYLDLLSKIDIAIFNHNRQQAMGNIITLLGLGKKVYIRRNITPWKMFEDVGIEIFDIEDLTIDLISNRTKSHNQKRIKEYFSEKNYKKQLQKIFRS